MDIFKNKDRIINSFAWEHDDKKHITLEIFNAKDETHANDITISSVGELDKLVQALKNLREQIYPINYWDETRGKWLSKTYIIMNYVHSEPIPTKPTYLYPLSAKHGLKIEEGFYCITAVRYKFSKPAPFLIGQNNIEVFHISDASNTGNFDNLNIALRYPLQTVVIMNPNEVLEQAIVSVDYHKIGKNEYE